MSGPGTPRAEPDPTRFGLAGDHPHAAGHRFAHEAMHTVFELISSHQDAAYAARAARAAFDLVDRLEQDLSRFVANSDVARIGRLGPGEHTRVSPSTMDCLGLARLLHDLTEGAFDVSLGSGLLTLELFPDDLTVLSPRGAVHLDLGGIGKGFAVDRAVELLDEWDLGATLVHGGFSSVRTTGAPEGDDGWHLTLRAPASGEPLARLVADRAALSASGVQKGAHIVDPRSGAASERSATWVELPVDRLEPEDARRSAAALAEGLSTAFMLLREDSIAALCAAVPGTRAWLLSEAGGDDGVHLVHFGPARGGAAGGGSSG